MIRSDASSAFSRSPFDNPLVCVFHESRHRCSRRQRYRSPIQSLLQLDLTQITLEVRAKNRGAREFYVAAGYREVALVPGYYGRESRVRVHYTGWTTDGRMFDSSIVKNEPGEFSLNGGVIAGWTEGIPMFAIGDKGRLWVPDTLAYKGQQGRPQGMLVFDVELVSIPGPQP